MTGLLVVLVGGACGAAVRAEVVGRAGRPGGLGLRVAVLNLVGSLLLGLLVGAADRLPALLVTGLGVGLLGALTTYSTWGADLLALWRENRRGAAWLLGIGQLLAGVALAGAGLWLGHRV